jgi:hypothetical protein
VGVKVAVSVGVGVYVGAGVAEGRDVGEATRAVFAAADAVWVLAAFAGVGTTLSP